MEQTELQQSIFNAPPAGSAAQSSGLPPKPAAPAASDDKAMKDAGDDARGHKRTRDEEEDEDSDEDVAMEEDSDDE